MEGGAFRSAEQTPVLAGLHAPDVKHVALLGGDVVQDLGSDPGGRQDVGQALAGAHGAGLDLQCHAVGKGKAHGFFLIGAEGRCGRHFVGHGAAAYRQRTAGFSSRVPAPQQAHAEQEEDGQEGAELEHGWEPAICGRTLPQRRGRSKVFPGFGFNAWRDLRPGSFVGDVGHDPALAPVGLLLLGPEFREEDQRLETRRQVLLPVGPPCGGDVHRILVQVADGAAVVGEGSMHIHQLVEGP